MFTCSYCCVKKEGKLEMGSDINSTFRQLYSCSRREVGRCLAALMCLKFNIWQFIALKKKKIDPSTTVE